MKTSTMAQASRATVNFSEVKNETIFLMSIGILGRQDELVQRGFLLGNDVGVAHQFVEPSLAGVRDDDADEAGGFAGAGIGAGEVHDAGLAIGKVERVGGEIGDGGQAQLAAPAVDVGQEAAAAVVGGADVHVGLGVTGGDDVFGDEERGGRAG